MKHGIKDLSSSSLDSFEKILLKGANFESEPTEIVQKGGFVIFYNRVIPAQWLKRSAAASDALGSNPNPLIVFLVG